MKHKNLFFILLILAMVLFYVFSGGSVGISLDFGEETLTVSASDEDWAIPYQQITSLALTELPDAGTPIESIEKRTLRCGIWKNDMWGQYILCIDPRIDLCIVVTTENGNTYVLNYENSDSTEQLYKMFSDLLHSKGYLTKN